MMLQKMSNGYSSHYMKLMAGSEMKGVVCFNVDHTCQTELRAYIRHITVKDQNDFVAALKVVIEFIWSQLNAATIRVDLYHFTDADGKLQANPDIKEALSMKRQGFKWKTLINDPETGKRF